MIKKILISVVLLSFFSCTDKGIEKQHGTDKKIYKIQEDFYLRRISIESEILYIRCTEDGQFISNPLALKYKKGKQLNSTGFVIE